MKKIVFLMAAVLLALALCSCTSPASSGNSADVKKEGNALSFNDRVAELSAVNFSIDIPKKDMLAESGVIIATYNSKEGANSLIDSFSGMCDVEKFDTDKKNTYVLIVATLGEGKSAEYKVTDIYMNTRNGVPNIDIFVETAGNDETKEATYQYHLLEVESAYINQSLTVYLDGEKVTK